MEQKMKDEKKFDLEQELMVKLHKDEVKYAQSQARKTPAPASQSPIPTRKQADAGVAMANLPANYVSPEILAKHEANVARLEEELEAERKLRREADAEIIKLRATINGVQLKESEVQDLLAQQLESAPPQKDEHPTTIEEDDEEDDEEDETVAPSNGSKTSLVEPEVTGAEEQLEKSQLEQPTTKKVLTKQQEQEELEKIKQEAVTPQVVSALNKLGINSAKDNRIFSEESNRSGVEEKQEAPRRPFLLKSPSEYLPMIRRGFNRGNEEKAEEQVISVGWKVEVRNRKEREELLRDEVDRFEIKMKRFSASLEEGIDITLWQLSRKVELGGDEKDEFGLKSTAVTVKLHRRGDLYVQAVLAFTLRGGYLSKAIGRHRADKAALEPLSLYDILEVKAGCSGYDHTELPSSSGKGKSKSGKKSKSDNRQASLFLTVKATPTPEASFRSYIFKFKSRSARNDVLNGLRSILADMQIREGVSISSIQQNEDDQDEDEIMVPLSEVHNAINREREAYDRLLLLLLQGQEDLKEKEDEMLTLRGRLESVMNESEEKDRVQANDSKLIMQLSKKLETLLMDNEDLRDQNDRLNSRLVSVECEKMNLMSG
uniref:Uncharacterized protein n=1 Tax=Cyclophora tenuis TaxID=216820 RepID=A0A7S1D3X9_CYCTE|mmetsp:Transcript_22115/g.37633  ORF Transcript_22115/g.37633 Transcript_22115/m.37633 type:complete len:602 (+) Transcript_22115:1367-3172(+)